MSRRSRRAQPFLVVLASFALLAAACAAPATTPAPTQAFVGDVRTHLTAAGSGLAQALEQYRGGEAAAAMDTLAETYEEHFEPIEDFLGDRNSQLKEDLEELIATDIRGAMQAGRPAADVATLITQATTGLGSAAALFQ